MLLAGDMLRRCPQTTRFRCMVDLGCAFPLASATGATSTTGGWTVLLEILVLLGAAAVLGSLAERFRQSALVGYLLAGMLVGPSVLGWVGAEQHLMDIAELGVALLLFTIGLEFSPQTLMRLGRIPLLTGCIQLSATIIAGWLLAWLLGLSSREAFVVGAMIALSSTACVLRLLSDRAELDSPHGRAVLGALLIQDMAVVPLVLITAALGGGGSPAAVVRQLAISLGLGLLLVIVFYVLFYYVVPRLFVQREWRQNRELPTLLALVMPLGAAWAAHHVGLSPAMGAFVAGVLLAASPYAVQITADVQPIKVVLVTLFFSAVGMFADPAWMVQHLHIVVSLTVMVVLGKAVLAGVAAWLSGAIGRVALLSGIYLAQIGEFSFVLATLAHGGSAGGGLLSDLTFRAMVSATVASLLLTPYLISGTPRAVSWWNRKFASQTAASDGFVGQLPPDDSEGLPLALIIGFGPAGRRAAEELLASGYRRIVVIDLNRSNLDIAQRYGLQVGLGDATRNEFLVHCQVRRAAFAVVALPSTTATRQIIQLLRQLSPGIWIVARSRYHIHRWQLMMAGAQAVVDEEDHVGRRMAGELLSHWNAMRVTQPTAARTPHEGQP